MQMLPLEWAEGWPPSVENDDVMVLEGRSGNGQDEGQGFLGF
jgi:hypothetical protein